MKIVNETGPNVYTALKIVNGHMGDHGNFHGKPALMLFLNAFFPG